MKILIKGGHLVDPVQGIDGPMDILIEDGRVKEVFEPGSRKPKVEQTVDAMGCHVLPGLIDMHVHLREPGFEHKETIKTGTEAAVRGGVTGVCCMPNTKPVHDNAGITEYILQKAREEGMCDVYPVGAITKGQEGKELAEIGMMHEEGCVAFSDDGHPVMSSIIMRRALEYAKTFDVPLISHCEDMSLVDKGVMNEGVVSLGMGLRGIPHAAEDTMVFRDVALAELTGGRLHIAHVSTEGSVRIIRDARKRGVNVTAETCPHYFHLTDDAAIGFNTAAKVNPPLRTKADVAAIREGLRDGTLEVIATDHAPHHKDEKGREFDLAPSGISGLDTSLALTLELVANKVITMSDLVMKMSAKPASILGIKDKGTLRPGSVADIAVVDINREFAINADSFVSRGKNTPFDGRKTRGMVMATIVKGKVYEWR